MARICADLGFPAGVRVVDDPEWPCILIDLPTGQVSWHISQEDLKQMSPLPDYEGEISQYTTEEKYRRLHEWDNFLKDGSLDEAWSRGYKEGTERERARIISAIELLTKRKIADGGQCREDIRSSLRVWKADVKPPHWPKKWDRKTWLSKKGQYNEKLLWHCYFGIVEQHVWLPAGEVYGGKAWLWMTQKLKKAGLIFFKGTGGGCHGWFPTSPPREERKDG